MWMALVTCVYSSSVILTLLSLITLLADDVTCEIYVSHVKLARRLIAFKNVKGWHIMLLCRRYSIKEEISKKLLFDTVSRLLLKRSFVERLWLLNLNKDYSSSWLNLLLPDAFKSVLLWSKETRQNYYKRQEQNCEMECSAINILPYFHNWRYNCNQK